MPTIAEASQTNRAGLSYVSPATTTAPPVNQDFQPSGTLMLRCPLPPVSVTPDTLRSFYLGSRVPQFRALTPGQNNMGSNSNGASVTNVTTIGTTSGGGTTSTNKPQTAQSASLTTSFLTPGSGFKGVMSVSTFKAMQLLNIRTTGAARVVLYGTAGAQSSDFSRGLDVPPGAGTAQNIATDVAMDTAPFTWTYQDRVIANGDSPQKTVIYVSVFNLAGSTAAITLTLSYVPLEI